MRNLATNKFALAMLAVLLMSESAKSVAGKEKKMTDSNLKTLVEATAKTIPFRKHSVETLLHVELAVSSENEYFTFLKATYLRPNRFELILSAVDLRLKKGDHEHPGFLSIEFSQPPASLEKVKSIFPGGVFEPPMPGPPPEGISPNAEPCYWVQREWGQLAFGFRAKDPKKLTGISFHAGTKD